MTEAGLHWDASAWGWSPWTVIAVVAMIILIGLVVRLFGK